MATPFGELITDSRDGPVLRYTRGRWVGSKAYRVNTHDEAAAIEAPGVPIYGESWSSDRPLLRVVDLECRYMHGTNISGDNIGGWSKVRLQYEEDPVGIIVPRPGDSYTDANSESSSINVRYGIDADGSGDGAQNEPIANGKGASKDVGGMLFDIHVFIANDSNAVLQQVWPLLAGKVFNQNAISLPPMLTNGAGQRIAVPAGWAQYYDFRRGVVDGVVEYIHTLRIAPDGAFIQWRAEAERGHATGPIRQTRIYGEANFDGLWPGP